MPALACFYLCFRPLGQLRFNYELRLLKGNWGQTPIDSRSDSIHFRPELIFSLHNFNTLYMPLADQWAVFDNTVAAKATLVATQEGDNLQIKEPKLWHKLQNLIKTA